MNFVKFMELSSRLDCRLRKRCRPIFHNLAAIGLDALTFKPPLPVLSILGLPNSWVQRKNPYSEFRIINVWRLGRTLRFLANVIIPSVPHTPPVLACR